ncbi:hypothetical protein PS2_030351 [Malus domestica]|uniref:vascular-related unknown protein 3-like isoform X1 n=1 Tax=Malus domestica TaxID=3750 RepID=UPI000498846C|nr:vascular-related unknown protein 3-like isoform X1 [Malus domestica]
MEDRSRNSMMGRGNSSDTRTTTQESPEESSWTMYLQDFMITNSQDDDDDDDDRSSFSSYGYENCSIISDAASSVTRKFTINGEVLGFGVVGGYNRSDVMIKRKPKEAFLDDALEDTASSPVNSPKVCNLSQSTVEPTIQKDYKDIPNAEKGSASGRVDERNESGFIGRESDCTELKKRGLCLVPFSMVANYFG